MNDINITLGSGGLNRDVSNYDVISGLALYVDLEDASDFTAANITSFTDTDRIKKFTSLDEFEIATGIDFNNSATEEIWYQVKEYFRIAGNTPLWVGLFYDTNYATTPVPLTYNELKDMQVYADGEIRQMGVYSTQTILTGSEIEKVQSKADYLFENHMPLSFVVGFNSSSISLTSLEDLRNLSTPSHNVSAVILQDGANYGAALSATKGYSIPALGCTLGAISLANVNESIAWVQKFNVAGEGELDEPAFGDGTLLKDTLDTTIDQLNSYGYIFGIKHVGINGTYFNDNNTCDTIISDYAYISEVRVINKATRTVRTTMLPYLNSPLKVNTKTGALDNLTILTWTNAIKNALLGMSQASEISGYSVYIDPNQNVLATSKVNVEIKIVPYGTAREINVTIGFSATL